MPLSTPWVLITLQGTGKFLNNPRDSGKTRRVFEAQRVRADEKLFHC